MPRTALTEVDKLKYRIIGLPDEESDMLFTWFEALLDVRALKAADKKREIYREEQQKEAEKDA